MKKFIIAALLVLPVSAFAQKFAHVSFQEIIVALPEYATAEKEMQDVAKQYDDEYKRMSDEFNTKLEDYQKKVSTGLPDAIRQRNEEELQNLQNRIQQFAQTSQQELEKLQAQKMQVLQEKVMKAVEEVGAAGQYTYIFPANQLLYKGADAKDITAEVKAKLAIK